MKMSCWDQREKLAEPSTSVHGAPFSVWHGEPTGFVSFGYELREEPPPPCILLPVEIGVRKV